MIGGNKNVNYRYFNPFNKRIYFCSTGYFSVFLEHEKIWEETNNNSYRNCICVLLLSYWGSNNDRYWKVKIIFTQHSPNSFSGYDKRTSGHRIKCASLYSIWIFPFSNVQEIQSYQQNCFYRFAVFIIY